MAKARHAGSDGATTSPPFLNIPFGGYLHRDVPLEDAELTHVGPGTPCGEWLRRFWHPVLLADKLKDLPVAIRILGEDLVLFRDRSSQAGLLELHCSHRGTSLEFGQIEERGIRCCYHAWLYDVDGRLLETPGEPAESTLKDRLYHGAYPTHEYKGLVFAYMGPPDKRPAFPILDMCEMPGYHAQARMHEAWPCNWLQFMENVHDLAHLSFLHTIDGNVGFTQDLARVGELDFIESPMGIVCTDTLRAGDKVWVIVADYMLPNLHSVAGSLRKTFAEREPGQIAPPMLSLWMVPVDDTHTQRFDFWYAPEGELFSSGVMGQTGDRLYEERQRVPGDYDAMVSQRPIEIHALEHLANTDRAVIMGRNMVRRGIRAVQSGEDPQGVTWSEGVTTPIYAHERVLHIPPAPNPEEDKRLLRDAGRRAVEERIEELSRL